MHITKKAYVPARARFASAIASVVITTTLLGSVLAGFDFKASGSALSTAQAEATAAVSRVSDRMGTSPVGRFKGTDTVAMARP